MFNQRVKNSGARASRPNSQGTGGGGSRRGEREEASCLQSAAAVRARDYRIIVFHRVGKITRGKVLFEYTVCRILAAVRK